MGGRPSRWAHGNRVLQFWAPPVHRALARACHGQLLQALAADTGTGLMLLGVPGRLPEGLQSAQPALFALLARCVPVPPQGSGWRALPAADRAATFDTWCSGHLVWRERRLDASGQSRVHSQVLGRPLLLCRPAVVAAAWQATPRPAPVQCLTGVLDNPFAGLRQPDAQRLRELLVARPGDLALMWHLGASVVAVGGADALAALHAGLASCALGLAGTEGDPAV